MTTRTQGSLRATSFLMIGTLALSTSLSGCAYIGAAIALSVSGGSSSTTKANLEPSVSFVGTPVPQESIHFFDSRG